MSNPLSTYKPTGNLLTWRTMPLTDKPKNFGWADEAIYNDNIVFRLYYDNEKSTVYLEDVLDKTKYSIPDGSKSKGYLVAFKLNNLRIAKGKK